jgi:hypothetical protein
MYVTLNRKSSKAISIGGRSNNSSLRAAFTTANECHEAASVDCFLAGYPLSELLAIVFINLHPHALDELLEILSSKQSIISFEHAERIASVSVVFEHKLAKKLIVVCAVLVNLRGGWLGLFRLDNSSFSILSSDSASDTFTDLIKGYFSILASISNNLLAEDVVEA